MSELKAEDHLTLKADEEGCSRLVKEFGEITALYNASSRADKQYVMSYMRFKELVRYFLEKQGSRRNCALTKRIDGNKRTFIITIRTPTLEVLNSAIFTDS